MARPQRHHHSSRERADRRRSRNGRSRFGLAARATAGLAGLDGHAHARVWPRRWPNWRSAPQDVTHVVITHPHGDHYPGVVVSVPATLVPRFPRARHFLGRADWEGNPRRGEPGSDLDRLELIDRLGLLELVNDEQEIVPGVTIVPAPGESPGHCVVRLESAGEVFYVLGDIVHHACEVEHPDWGPPHADPDTWRPRANVSSPLSPARERCSRPRTSRSTVVHKS